MLIYTTFMLRSMASHQWPGLDTGGLAWFTDLTCPAYIWSTGDSRCSPAH